MINVNGREIETDAEGYLASLDDWNEDVAKCLAERDQLDLGEEHWMVVRWIRDYYAENGTAPNLRVMSKLIGGALGEQFGDKKKARELYKQVLEFDPQHSEARQYLGLAASGDEPKKSGGCTTRVSCAGRTVGFQPMKTDTQAPGCTGYCGLEPSPP